MYVFGYGEYHNEADILLTVYSSVCYSISMKIYKTRRKLVERLKDEGLISNRMALDMFEKAKIIPEPKNGVDFNRKNHFGNGVMRIYSDTEIEDIVKIVRKHQEKNS